MPGILGAEQLHKNNYYKLLQNVRFSEAWEDWIIFILKGIEETAADTIQKVKAIKKLLEDTAEKVKTEAPKIYSKELIETLYENPYCKVEFIVKSLGVERKAASRYLHQLEDIGILKCMKVGKDNLFINIGLMDLLKEQRNEKIKNMLIINVEFRFLWFL